MLPCIYFKFRCLVNDIENADYSTLINGADVLWHKFRKIDHRKVINLEQFIESHIPDKQDMSKLVFHFLRTIYY